MDVMTEIEREGDSYGIDSGGADVAFVECRSMLP